MGLLALLSLPHTRNLAAHSGCESVEPILAALLGQESLLEVEYLDLRPQPPAGRVARPAEAHDG
jgi:hypothetical protein